MAVLVAEMILGAMFYGTLKNADVRSAAKRALLLVGLSGLATLCVVQWELAQLSPDGTYGSDARYYYAQMRATVEANAWWPAQGTLSPGYVAWGAAVLYSSPSDSVVWVKLANIGLLLLVLLLGFNLMEYWGVRAWAAYYATLLYGLNGTVLWMVVRNLKDSVLLFLTLGHVLLSLRVLSTRWPAVVRVGAVIVLGMAAGFVYATIRPWGLYWSGAVFAGSVLEAAHRSMLARAARRRGTPVGGERGFGLPSGIAVLVTAGALVGIVLNTRWEVVQEDLRVLQAYSELSGGLAGRGLREYLVAVPRFLIGPGPIRALFGWEAFQVTTTTGNILVALGSLLWWLCVPLLIGGMLRGTRYWAKHGSILVVLLMHIAVYSFAYAGSLETRFRAIVYVLSALLMGRYIQELRWRRPRRRMGLVMLAGMVVWFGGLYESYRSLSG